MRTVCLDEDRRLHQTVCVSGHSEQLNAESVSLGSTVKSGYAFASFIERVKSFGFLDKDQKVWVANECIRKRLQ